MYLFVLRQRSPISLFIFGESTQMETVRFELWLCLQFRILLLLLLLQIMCTGVWILHMLVRFKISVNNFRAWIRTNISRLWFNSSILFTVSLWVHWLRIFLNIRKSRLPKSFRVTTRFILILVFTAAIESLIFLFKNPSCRI